MNCPHCQLELEKEFYHGFVCYRCPECGGHLITISGLRNLSADKPFVNLLWKTACYGYSEPGPECGNCPHPMRRVTLPLNGVGLELDVCQNCQFIWFDPAELERIPLPKAAKELPPEAKEKLALMQIRKEKERIEQIYQAGGKSVHSPEIGWQYLAGLLGLPVELDAPAVKKTPWITWGLALICIAVFILTCRDLGGIVREWGFIPDAWSRKGGLTLGTSMFLHGGLFHLIGNMYFLLIFGDNVEDEIGKTDYLLLILFSGLSALGLHSLLDPRSAIPCIGASGFISGIIACYAVCFPKVRLSFMLWKNVIVLQKDWNWFSIPAWAALLLWLIWQGFMALTIRSTGGGTAYLAHLGGALPGLILALRLRYCRCHERRP